MTARPIKQRLGAQGRSPDIADRLVAGFRRELGQLAPEFDAFWTIVLGAVRRDYGGAAVYIKRRESVRARVANIAAALRDKVDVADAFARAGVSRAAGYRLLGRRAGPEVTYGPGGEDPIAAIHDFLVVLNAAKRRTPERVAAVHMAALLRALIDDGFTSAIAKGRSLTFP